MLSRNQGIQMCPPESRMPDAAHLPLNVKNRRPGWASLRAAPTTLGAEDQQEIRETGLSKNPFL